MPNRKYPFRIPRMGVDDCCIVIAIHRLVQGFERFLKEQEGEGFPTGFYLVQLGLWFRFETTSDIKSSDANHFFDYVTQVHWSKFPNRKPLLSISASTNSPPMDPSRPAHSQAPRGERPYIFVQGSADGLEFWDNYWQNTNADNILSEHTYGNECGSCGRYSVRRSQAAASSSASLARRRPKWGQVVPKKRNRYPSSERED